MSNTVKIKCEFINSGVASVVTSNNLILLSRIYLPTSTDPITWYVEDPISTYTSFFLIPAGSTIIPNSCLLVLSSDGTAYTASSYTFTGGTLTFSSY